MVCLQLYNVEHRRIRGQVLGALVVHTVLKTSPSKLQSILL